MFEIRFVEEIEAHFVCSITFSQILAVYKTMWIKHCRTRQATEYDITRRMRSACLITMATNTHSEYVILIVFPRQFWLPERASVSRYVHNACVVKCCYFLFYMIQGCGSFICSKMWGCLTLGSDGSGYGPFRLGFDTW